MKLIILHMLESKSPPRVYNSSIKIAYLISDVLITMGIDDLLYFYKENTQDRRIKTKIKLLKIFMPSTEQELASLVECEQLVKKHNQIKSKSSAVVIAYKQLTQTIDAMFEECTNTLVERLSVLGINEMKYLLNTDDFYFYCPEKGNPASPGIKYTSKEEVLQMLLPDKEQGGPALFFINAAGEKGKEIYDINFLDAADPMAENLENFYGEESFLFPDLLNLTGAEAGTIKNELKEPTRIFRAKMDEWALLCYDNPNSILGLQFFKKELKPLLQSMQKIVLQNSLIANRVSVFNQQIETQLIIGEAPIEKIWDIHFNLNNISREEYDHLLKIKTEQHPKYEGRWPVIFYKILRSEANDETGSEIEEEEIVISVRKILLLD
jgi:hypothetical protein